MSSPSFHPDRFDAVLFDLDGVLTDTARIHALCWKIMFDAFLQRRAAETGRTVELFDSDMDYRRHVDGKPRYDGVRDFLKARGIALPEGTPESAPDEISVCGLGNRKNELVGPAIRDQGVDTFPGSIAWLRRLREQGLRTAVVSSSANCEEVLAAAGIENLFDARVDGLVARELRLPGKPAPDTFVEAARRLGITPDRAVVVEDAISGVQAGRRGKFGLVIGVARHAPAKELLDNGADLVLRDLGDLLDPS